MCINIYAFRKTLEIGKVVELFCAIGDYNVIVKIVKEYIDLVDGFEKFAEWGLY